MAQTELFAWQQKFHDRGLEEGIERGIERGLEQGLEQGLERGALASARDLARLVVEDRFGPLPAEVRRKIEIDERLDHLKAIVRTSAGALALDEVLAVIEG